MVPHPASIIASLLILYALQLIKVVDSQTDRFCSVQPAVWRLDPPTGTTGRDARQSTNYTITGESLDQVSSISVLLHEGMERTLRTEDRMGNNSMVTFHIENLNLNKIINGHVSLVPIDTNCSMTNLSIILFPKLDISFGSLLRAQSGTTVFFTQSSCIPGKCGDNSTSFSVEVGGILLQPQSTQNTSLKYAGRFPNFHTSGSSQEVVIVTQYQVFRLELFLVFMLVQPPPIESVMPGRGQRGTNVAISVMDLQGHGQSVTVSRVSLGGTDAEIINASTPTLIQVRAGSGIPGNGSVLINTTDTFEGIIYDGPYTYLENGWSQLQDGTITHIVPQAAQEGHEIFLCGSSLLGGGTLVSAIRLNSTTFHPLIFSTTKPSIFLPGSECLRAEVPSLSQENDVNGIITIISNTGSLVNSIANFTIAHVDSVIPSRGQPGTTVTIRGQGLLSGYNSNFPIVFLSNVRARVQTWSSTDIIVRAGDPPTPLPRVINATTGATSAPPQYFGVEGSLRIEVANPFDETKFFNVSNASGWQLEESGKIDSISPTFGQHGTLITVKGTNLLAYGNNLTHVIVGGINATILAGTSNSTVKIIAPNATNIGSVDIVLFSDTGADIRGPSVFEYREVGIVINVSPRTGQNGTFVTITGTNLLGYGQNITSVYFSDIQAIIDYSTITDTSIQVRVQANNNSNDQPAVIVIVSDTSAFVQSKEINWTFLVQGQITSNLPQQGQAGTKIEIVGMNLLGGGNTIAKILLDGGSVTVANHSNILIVVLDDLHKQHIGFYPGQIYIESDTGAVVIGGTYMHKESGIIDSFSPTRGRRGTIVTILGHNLLGYSTSLVQVQIAGIVCTLESFNDTVTVVLAGFSLSTQAGSVILTADTGAFIISSMSFTFDEPGIVALISPIEGTEGTGVSISGSGLLPSNLQLTSITIGGVPVTRVVTASNREMVIIVGPAPAINADNASIIIRASDGSFVDGFSFTFISFKILLPNISHGREGTLMVIRLPNSSHFDPNANLRATVDNQYADIVSTDSNQQTITVRIPRASIHGVFLADVAIEGMNGLIATLKDAFTYHSEGIICVVEPTQGQTGTRINLEGENFLGGGSMLMSVLVVGQHATVLSFNNRTVSLQLSQIGGIDEYQITGDILLTADTGAIVRRQGAFTLISPGNITKVSPLTGQHGTRVNITGTGLIQGNMTILLVTLAGVPAIMVGTSNNTLITVEASLSSSASSSALPVIIMLSTGATITSSTNETIFQYLVPGRITSVSPNSGSVGTRSTIIGTNLLQGGQRVSQVFLKGVAAVVIHFSDTSISVTAQEDNQGRGDVLIVSDTGSTVAGTGLWTYDDLGTISGVFPAVSQQGVLVIITGESLLGSATRFTECRLAGILGKIVPPFSNKKVQCKAGVSLFSTIDNSGPVQLTTDTGIFLDSSDNNITFTYYANSINAISPSQGNNGTEVTITGLNLLHSPNASSQIYFGSVQTTILSASLDEILVRVEHSNNATSDDRVRIEYTSGAFLEIHNAWSYTRPGQLLYINPPYSLPGEQVILYGENLFNNDAAEYRVILGRTEAFNVRVINASVVQFQAGAYQNSDLPEQDLPVQVVSSTGETTYNPNLLFRYNTSGGIVLSISPLAGSEGSTVVISGEHLPNISNIMQITLVGVMAKIESAGVNMITVKAGQPPGSGGSGQIIIENNDGTIIGLAGDAWRYFPVITSRDVLPPTGQNGTVVSINLSRMFPLPSLFRFIRVNLNMVTAEILEINSSILAVRAGPSDNTPLADITLELTDGIITIFHAWSYQEPVSIDQLSLPNGYFNTSINIMGRMFQANSVTIVAVYLAGVETIVESQSNTQLRVRISEAVTPATADGISGPVIIIADSGATHSSSKEVNFTYIGVQVTRVSPHNGTRGTLITLSGENLLAGGSTVISVTIARINASIQAANSSIISFIAGSSETFSVLGNITYLMDTGASVHIINSWRYLKPGEVMFVSPLVGEMGTIISITGTNLFGGGSRAVAVFLTSHKTTDILKNFDHLIQVRAIAGTGSSQSGSIWIISDTQAITESPNTIQFSYLSPAIFMSISPRRGQNGTIVTIIGDHFHNGEGIARVFLAGVEARITNIQDTSATTSIIIEAGRPKHLGSIDGPVVVQSSLNTTSISTQIFMYNTEGVILSVTPNVGRNNTLCSIEGKNLFGGGMKLQGVVLAGVNAAIISQTSSKVVTRAGLAPSSNSSTGNIVLISDTNAHVTRIDGWTNIQQGVITTISPPQGQVGTIVTISGQHILSGGGDLSRLLFGDVDLSITSATDSAITAIVGQPASNSEYISDSVTLVSDFGGELYLEYNWNFLNQSNITSLFPLNGFGETVVTITGINLLGGGTRIASAYVGGIQASVISSSNDQVVIITGANGSGMEIVGTLVLESDTGALTTHHWHYDRECPNNAYGTVGSCLPCDSECEACMGPSNLNCTACANFAIFRDNSSTLECVSMCPNVSTLDNVCIDTCKINQYAKISTERNQTLCYECNFLCAPNLGCSGPEHSQCHSCRFFKDVLNQTCIEDCLDEAYYVNEMKECRPCHQQCSGGCFGPSDAECLKCANLIVGLISVVTMSGTIPNDVCRKTCPSLYYEDTGRSRCIPCDPNCSEGCTGPNPFQCMRCSRAFFLYPNGTRMCVTTCNPTHYQDANNNCNACSSLCLPSSGCRGPNPSDCNVCSLSENNLCVSGCSDSTYFIRNSTRTCEKCDTFCGIGGCTESGTQNCLTQNAFAAGSGTTAIVIIIIIILAIVIIFLVMLIVRSVWHGGSSNHKVNFSSPFKRVGNTGVGDNNAKYTQSHFQDIPLTSKNIPVQSKNIPVQSKNIPVQSKNIPVQSKNIPVQSKNIPVQSKEDKTLFEGTEFSKMNAEHKKAQERTPSSGKEISSLPPKSQIISGSQGVYADVDNLAPLEIPDVYTDVEVERPSLLHRAVDTALFPPHKLAFSINKKSPVPHKTPELDTDIHDGITEIFINTEATEHMYDDACSPAKSSSLPSSIQVLEDSVYEDTDNTLAMMKQYHKSSSTGKINNIQFTTEPAKSSGKSQLIHGVSAPALPSGPIPKKRLNNSLPLTPLQKSLSSSSVLTAHAPLTQTQSVTSIPQEESLYDDISGVNQVMQSSFCAKEKAPKKQTKGKRWKI